MAPLNAFNDLAIQFVVADNQHAAAKAVEIMEAPAVNQGNAANRVLVGQWVASINRWMPQPDSGYVDDDIILRAKALDFLASTLEALKKETLKADQVKLMVGFFTSLFSSDHRAGVRASAKALRQLATMKNFQPSLGSDIITKIANLGDDFKHQTPATRLDIYELILTLLLDQQVASELAAQQGHTCGFMKALINLCRNERDPRCLMKWLEIMKVFLESYSPDKEVVQEVFKAFSAYFPITLRASSTPSGITVEDLKGAVRACFAAHYQLADLAIPFLINKLDLGEAVTVAVKVDILQTLEACLSQYSDTKQGIGPYAEQIWGSLKYEVRNGEILDSIKATLKAIGTLTKRLEGPDLQAFLTTVWVDLVDDLVNSTYTSQAGKLLTSIAGASPQSFELTAKLAVSHIQDTLRRTNDASHQAELLAVLNSLLLVRSHLTDQQDSSGLLQDELFGDRLFEGVYAPLWKSVEQSQTMHSSMKVKVLSKLTDGMASLAMQYSSSDKGHLLCSEAICNQIFSWLGKLPVIDPLEGRTPPVLDLEHVEVCNAAVQALRRAAPHYPPGYQQLLLQFLSSLPMATETGDRLSVAAANISSVTKHLASIGCTDRSRGSCPIVNFVSLVNILLKGLHGMLKKSPVYWTAMVDSIHVAVLCTLDQLKAAKPGENVMDLPYSNNIMTGHKGIPEIDIDQLGNLELATDYLNKMKWDDESTRQFVLQYCLLVISQIYRRFTVLDYHTESVHLSADFNGTYNEEVANQQDRCLHKVGDLATSIARSFTAEGQKKAHLLGNAFVMFHNPTSLDNGHRVILDTRPLSIGSSDGRTAMLTIGILAGLWPSAMVDLYDAGTLPTLTKTLTDPSCSVSTFTRAILNSTLTILSNKITPDRIDSPEWLETQNVLTNAYDMIVRRIHVGADIDACLANFKTICHFLAGDVARFCPSDGLNTMLHLVCATAPLEPTIGRQLGLCFEIMVSPKDCLQKENHAQLKTLRGQWIYHEAVLPYLKDCFPPPSGTAQDDRCATNRAVAIFAILKHVDFAVYRGQVDEILRIAIRSLTTFGTKDKAMDSLLTVLRRIQDNVPKSLEQHIKPLIENTLAVYWMARNVNDSLNYEGMTIDKASRRDAAMCRFHGLDFIGKLANLDNFPGYLLHPHRMAVLRGLERACGDPVREVREIAIRGRMTWNTLDGE